MNRSELLELIFTDVQARDGGQDIDSFSDEASRIRYMKSEIRRMYFNKGEKLFRFTLWMRIHENTKRMSPLWLFGTFMYKREIKRSGVHLSCPVGTHFHVVHESDSYLNAESIGNHFTVYQGVTLGVDGKGGKPVIGDHVTVYTNAVICGDIHIGDYCVIGANAFVNRDMPAHSMAIASTIIKQPKKGNCNA